MTHPSPNLGLRPFAAAVLFALVWLTASSFAVERPIALTGGSNDLLNLPEGTDAMWIPNGFPGDVKLLPKTIPRGTVGLAKGLEYIVPCRLRVRERWTSIFPLFTTSAKVVMATDGLKGLDLGATNLTEYDSVIGIVPEGGSVRFRYSRSIFRRLRVEIIAKLLGSQLDPVIRVLDEDGKEMSQSINELFADRDLAMRFEAPRSGKAIVEIRDIANAGGPTYFFYLSVLPPPESSDNFGRLPYQFAWPDTPAFSTDSQKIAIGARGRGQFHERKQIDRYTFNVEENEKLILSAETRRFGSPCDVRISLLDSAGKQLSESVGEGPNGPSLTNRFAKAGTYRVEISELSGVHGIGAAYWFGINRAKPGVTLTSEIERTDFSKDGEAKIKIACKRYDYDGPVKLRFDGLPEGVQIIDDVLPEKKNEVEVKLKRTKEVEAFQVRIYGGISAQKEANETKPEEFPVSTMPALRKLFPLQMFPCAAMDGWIAVNPPL